jgi:hypothetical protein
MNEQKLRTGAGHLRPNALSVLALVGAPVGAHSVMRAPIDTKHLVVAYYGEIPEVGLPRMNLGEYRETDAHGGKITLSSDGRVWTYQPVSGPAGQYRVGIDVRVPEQGETVFFYGPAMIIDGRNRSQRSVLDRISKDFENSNLRP